MIYPNSDSCQQQLKGVEAIDYFIACQVTQELNQAQEPVFFHLLVALQWALRQGHSCLPLTQVMGKVLWDDSDGDSDQAGYQFPSLDELNNSLNSLAILADDNAPIVLDQQALYLRRYWQYEIEVAQILAQRMALSLLNKDEINICKDILNQLFTKAISINSNSNSNTDSEVDWQQVAVANALGRRLSIISGGPGTGKTYTITRLLATLQAVNGGRLKILMAAPTGKAAQRLKESIINAKQELKNTAIDDAIINSIPESASTLHRLLGFRPHSINLSFDAKHPLKCDVLLIDEVSMIDLPMMARILRALPETAHLILLGDADQLPSVETGSVLADISCHQHPGYLSAAAAQIQSISGQSVNINDKSNYSHLTLLTRSHRFGGEIGSIANEVIHAKAEESWQRLKQHEQNKIDFQYISSDKNTNQLSYVPDSLFESWIKQSCLFYFTKIVQSQTLKEAFSALAAFRILVPTKVGDRGVIRINQLIEHFLSNESLSKESLNQNNFTIKAGSYYRGRPIMVTQNSYAMNLFNGDVGLIWPNEQGKLFAWFEKEDGEYHQISIARLPSNETVYAMTIHKTQGSEFNHVAIILPQQELTILCPELLYTGLTRAKEHLYIISSEAVWKSSLKERSWRYSGLKNRLK